MCDYGIRLFAHENDPDIDDDAAAAEVSSPSGNCFTECNSGSLYLSLKL